MIAALFALAVIALFSALAFWKETAVLFIITGGISIIFGFEAPDLISSTLSTTPLDTAIALSFFGYALFCLASAYKLMFWRGEADDEED